MSSGFPETLAYCTLPHSGVGAALPLESPNAPLKNDLRGTDGRQRLTGIAREDQEHVPFVVHSLVADTRILPTLLCRRFVLGSE